jgi:cell division protein FtsI/penicillin-binding protein 2
LNISQEKLKNLLRKRTNRYIKISSKISSKISQEITKLKNNPEYKNILRGIQMRNEYWRYYPEQNLASQILGFVDRAGQGNYGLEQYFDEKLKGRAGRIYGATSLQGERILTGDESGIIQAKNGDNLVLTIDRVVQKKVEQIMTEDLLRYDANFGQAIVVEPNTGHILAMVNVPTFNPNDFGREYLKYEITPEQEQLDRESDSFNKKIPTIFDKGIYYRFFNLWGSQIFRNKTVSDIYEPGSVIKALTIAGAINSQEVVPQTTYDDTGPIKVDEFEIRNASDQYKGKTTVLYVLTESLNTGIAFITKKMGARLLYEYLYKLGFGQYTDIQLGGELSGQLEDWNSWEASELVTRGFGQGISATPLQVVMAFASLANGGYLMKPILIEKIISPDGKVEEFFPKEIARIFSNKTYNIMKSMLYTSVERGVARGAKLKNYTVMGKTGTSQTYKNGKAQEGLGTTITSFAGFGTIKNPRFVVLVKFDYPKNSQWGSETAAVTFKRISKSLFEYFEILPDK